MKSIKDVNLYVANKVLFIVSCGLFVICLFVLGGFTSSTSDTPENINKTTYTLSYSSAEGGYLVGEFSRTIKEGQDGKIVTAHADSGWDFYGWWDKDTYDVRLDKNIKANIKVDDRSLTFSRILLKIFISY